MPDELVSEFVYKYFTNEKSITKEELRSKISKSTDMSFLQIFPIIKKVFDFLEFCYNKFTAEDK